MSEPQVQMGAGVLRFAIPTWNYEPPGTIPQRILAQ